MRTVARFLVVGLVALGTGLVVAFFGGCLDRDAVDRLAVERDFVTGCLKWEKPGITEAYCRCAFQYVADTYGVDALVREEERIRETGESSTMEEMGDSAFSACIQHADRDVIMRAEVEACVSQGIPEAYCRCAYEHLERTYGLYLLLREEDRYVTTGESSPLFDEMEESAYYACERYLP